MDEAYAFVCAKDFYQCLWLPATASHERLRVTYSTTRNFSDESLPAVMFCLPMFGSRLLGLDLDNVAKASGIRIICVDRPGMGGSTPAPLNIRVQVWLETVPAVLAKLHVKHISLFSHSAGTVYVLNTIFHLPEVLDPERPYVALIAPWVDCEHSKATLMSMVSKIPNAWFGNWNKLASFMATRIGPATAWSGGVVSSVAELFNPAPDDADADETSEAEKYGVTDEVAKDINKLRQRFASAEDTTAGNEEARLCLKKLGPGNLGACEDYEQFVGELMEKRKSQPKLIIRLFYAENDMMIGKGGQEYFEKCWRRPGVEEVFDYKSEELPGTNHETCILSLKKGALTKIFAEIAELYGR